MKKLILLFVLLASASSFAADFSKNVTCTSSNFRVSYFDVDADSFGKFNFKISSVNGKVTAKRYGGFLTVSDYNGVFSGKDLPEVPYQRASVYKKHYRFKDVDAVHTFGSETGMWGYFVIEKSIANASRGDIVDGHYVLQAGDHFGGTVDFECQTKW